MLKELTDARTETAETNRQKHLDADVERQGMNVPVSTETEQCREQPTATHSDDEEIPQVCPLGDVTTGNTMTASTQSTFRKSDSVKIQTMQKSKHATE